MNGIRSGSIVAGLSSLVLLSGLAVAPAASAAEQTASDKDTLIVWDINLGMKTKFTWQKFFERAGDENAYSRKPDIIVGQDIPSDRMGDVIRKLEAETDNTDYGYRHASVRSGTTGANVVIFRSARFSVESLHRWTNLQGKNECDRDGDTDTEKPEYMIAVRLLDKAQDKQVVASAVHWGKELSRRCIWRNIRRMESQLEGKWANRRLTVVGGDFNARPDYDEKDDDPQEWRMERDPECWYRSLVESEPGAESAYPWEDEDGCSLSFENGEQGHYYDAVWVDHFEEDADGDGTYDLCEQWTNFNAVGDETCTGGKPARHRIDYLWVRFENGDGTVATFDDRPTDLITEANTDQGYADNTRYSNHRGIHMVLKWPQ